MDRTWLKSCGALGRRSNRLQRRNWLSFIQSIPMALGPSHICGRGRSVVNRQIVARRSR
jgi:hypothetical protein